MSTTHVRLMKWYEGSFNENSLPLARLPFYALLDLMARRNVHVAQCTVHIVPESVSSFVSVYAAVAVFRAQR